MSHERIAILASGSGSNAEALVRAWKAGIVPGEVACIASDRPGAGVLDRALRLGVEALVVDAGEHAGRDAHERALVEQLRARGVTLVLLAGWMRVLGVAWLEAFDARTINVHPSLLPAYPGARAIEQALAAGERQTGVTFHFIDAGVDTGPAICRATVPVPPGADVATLAPAVHAVEHRAYPLVAAGAAAGELVLADGRVHASAALLDRLRAGGLQPDADIIEFDVQAPAVPSPSTTPRKAPA